MCILNTIKLNFILVQGQAKERSCLESSNYAEKRMKKKILIEKEKTINQDIQPGISLDENKIEQHINHTLSTTPLHLSLLLLIRQV